MTDTTIPDDFYWMQLEDWEDGDYKMRYYTSKGSVLKSLPMKPYALIETTKDNYDYVCAKDGRWIKKFVVDNFDIISDLKVEGMTWEADVSYERRVMLDMDLKIGTVPICYLDIETRDIDGASNPERDEIISIAMLWNNGDKEFLNLKNFDSEEMMLRRMMQLLQKTGMIVTWNGGEDIWETRSFDLPYLSQRYYDRYSFDESLKHVAFIDLMRQYKWRKQTVGQSVAGGYSLENISQHELGHGKIKHDGKKISEMTDAELEEYNMVDVELLKEIDDKTGITNLIIGIAQTCNLRLTDWRNNKKYSERSPLKQVDNMFLKTCRELGVRWPTHRYRKTDDESIIGAAVLESKVGIHHDVSILDVKSMYPSIIINEQYSPDQNREVIPYMLQSLLDKRKEQKELYAETKDVKYDISQYAYKIVANTAYGVLTNAGFRAFDKEMAQAITSKGQSLLREVKDLAEEYGFTVLYGDTDSIFVHIKENKAQSLCNSINRKISPYVLEVGNSFKSILFTGDLSGSKKKRYAGLMKDDSLYIKGLQAIRGDYTKLARQIQKDILLKLLKGETIDQCKQLLFDTRRKIMAGECDDMLIMSKGVKALKEYSETDKRGVKRGFPPHVRALKMAYDKGHTTLTEINYILAKNKEGVKPVIDGVIPDGLNHEAYYQNQVLNIIQPLFDSLYVQEGGKTNVSAARKKASQESQSLFSFQ